MSENQDKKMFLPFRVDEYQFAVLAAEVESIVEFPKFRSVPHTPESFMGVFSHRNKVVNLISLKRKFGLADDNNSGYVILTQIETCLAGFHVDEIFKLIPASDTIQTKMDWNSSFSSFRNILLHDNEIFIQTSFEQLFKLEELKISCQKNINTKPTIKKDIENVAESESIVIEKKKIPEPVEKLNYKSDVQTKKDKDTKTVDKQSKQKLGPKQQKYQAVNKTTKPVVDTSPASLKIEQSDKKNKTMLAYSWFAILIFIVLIVAGFYLFNTKEKQSDKNDNSKTTYQVTQNISLQTTNIKQKPYNNSKSILDSNTDIGKNFKFIEKKEIKAEKNRDIVDESTAVSNYTKTPTLVQPTPNNPENAETNELAVYTRKKKEEWVKIEKDAQSNSQNISQLNNIRKQDIKIETKEFTLIIERQKLTKTESSDQAYDKFLNNNYQVHIVVPGDTLWHLAKRFLGNPFWYKVLADTSMIKNPDLIYPGDKIHIIKKND